MTGKILCVGRACETVGKAVEYTTPAGRVWSFDDMQYIKTGGDKTVTITWVFSDGVTESEDWPPYRDYLPSMCPQCYKPAQT